MHSQQAIRSASLRPLAFEKLGWPQGPGGALASAHLALNKWRDQAQHGLTPVDVTIDGEGKNKQIFFGDHFCQRRNRTGGDAHLIYLANIVDLQATEFVEEVAQLNGHCAHLRQLFVFVDAVDGDAVKANEQAADGAVDVVDHAGQLLLEHETSKSGKPAGDAVSFLRRCGGVTLQQSGIQGQEPTALNGGLYSGLACGEERLNCLSLGRYDTTGGPRAGPARDAEVERGCLARNTLMNERGFRPR